MCVEELTEESLSNPPRIVTDYLDGLIINCEYSERGCTETMELGTLRTHASVCNYRPVACPNERCGATVNLKDLEEHKSTSCEYRLVHCEECDKDMSVKKYGKHACLLHKDMQEMKTVLLDMKTQVTQMQEKQDQRFDELVKLVRNLTSNGDKVRITEVQSTSTVTDDQPSGNILVLGGCGDDGPLKSVELYSVSEGTWRFLEPMLVPRYALTAHYYKGQVLVSGGCSDYSFLNTIECLQSKDGSLSWTESFAKLPFQVESHKTMIMDNHLIVVGGRSEDDLYVYSIHKIRLAPPFTSTVECSIQQLAYHGVQSFGNYMLIFGGSRQAYNIEIDEFPINNVWLYDTIFKSIIPMLPLPIPIEGMATVKCGEDVLIIGGRTVKYENLNTVFKYNYKKSTCEQLPSMKSCRADCAAVLSGNKVYVMGGRGTKGEELSSVECFDLDHHVWEELAPMNERKSCMAAILLPVNFF